MLIFERHFFVSKEENAWEWWVKVDQNDQLGGLCSGLSKREVSQIGILQMVFNGLHSDSSGSVQQQVFLYDYCVNIIWDYRDPK